MKKTAFCIILLIGMLCSSLFCEAEQEFVLEYSKDSKPHPDCFVSVNVEEAIIKLSRYYEDAWTAYLEGDVRCRWYLDGNELYAENEPSVLVRESYLGCYLQAVLICGEYTMEAKPILIRHPSLPPQITTLFLPDAMVGMPYQAVIESTDPCAVFDLMNATELLQCGLTLDAEGILAGTPQRSGVFRFTVTVAGQGGVNSYTFSLSVKEAPHVHCYSAWETVRDSTCAVQGKQQRSCACGYVESEFLPLVEHSWNEGIVTKEPTEEEKGERMHTCLVCGKTAKTEVEKLPHVHRFCEWIIGELPDCDHLGYRVRTCACGESETEYLDPTDHIWDAGVMTKEPSEAEEGEMTYTCGECGKARTEPISKLAHQHVYGNWQIDNEPSCKQKGSQSKVCPCGDTVSEELPRMEHAWDAGRVTKEPTDKEEGVFTYTCLLCGQTKSESIEKTAKEKPTPKPQSPLIADTSFQEETPLASVRMIFLVTALATALIGTVTVWVLKKIK